MEIIKPHEMKSLIFCGFTREQKRKSRKKIDTLEM